MKSKKKNTNQETVKCSVKYVDYLTGNLKNAMEKALSVSYNFVKWAKEQDVKDLDQLKRAHCKNYIEQKK
ncbi:hypothetical protein DEX24_12020 [Kurthia sibirica]|uniref:Uncharacterized protein n=1 Tax=Kurthia sibirica TaxID=202750 RepID=A0A2U3AJG6_9BACL|nr:hypothetical protein DEX24_12020 [Kurthia sibirica]